MQSLYSNYKKGYDLCIEQIKNLLELEITNFFKDNETINFLPKEYKTVLENISLELTPIKFNTSFGDRIKDLLELAEFYKDKMEKENIIHL